MEFNRSSQVLHWMFSAEDIVVQRKRTYEEARANFMDRGDLSSILTQEEEQVLRMYYIYKILDIGKQLKYYPKVVNTAVILFKRFYLLNSMLIRDPQVHIITALYVASKIEEFPVEATDICSCLKADREPVLYSEFYFLQSLRFHLKIYHPQDSLTSIKYELSAKNISIPNEVAELASKLVSFSLYTDACFLFRPSHIALVALRIAGQSKKCGVDFLENLIRGDDADKFKELEPQIKDCLKLGMKNGKIDEKAVEKPFKMLPQFYIEHQEELSRFVVTSFY